MALHIECGWDQAVVGTSSIRLTEDPGGTPDTITGSVGALTWCHRNLSGVLGSGNYQSFPTQLENALDAASANGYTYNVVFNSTTLRYTISAGSGEDFDIEYNSGTTAEVRMFQILGLAGASAGSTSTYTGTRVPYYVIGSAMGAASEKTDDYEPPGIVEGSFSDSGQDFSVSRTASPVFSDFSLAFEAKSASFKREATTTVPWTYQHMWEHARGTEPFVVVDDSESTVHRLRPEGGSFQPRRASADYDNYWHHMFKTYMLGRL